MKKLIYLVFTAFLFACTSIENKLDIETGRKGKTGAEAITTPNEGGVNNTFKEGLFGVYFDEFRKENQKEIF